MMFFQNRRGIPALVALVFASVSGSLVAQTLDAEQAKFVTLINNYRAQNGAGALQVSVALQNSSQWMSNDMATKNYFSHTDSLGRDPFTRMKAFGYPYSPAGENIAAGNSDAQNTFNQWVNACDPNASGVCTYAHRLNMLNASFKVLGIGRVYNASSSYRWYWTTDFGGVVDQTMNPNAPSDSLPPTTPTLSGSALSATSVKLTWTASTDNIAVTGYQIARKGVVIGTVSSGTTYTDSTAAASTTYTYTVRAYDAAGNYSPLSNTVTVTTPAGSTTTPPPTTSPTSIWPATATPQYSASTSVPVELGVKFKSDVSGKITGIRFYKPAGETGTHTGSLWSITGTLLATGTFVNETPSGWQTLVFSAPVAIAANTVYVASYHANYYLGITSGTFGTAGVDNGTLHALKTGVSGPNGVYGYGFTSVFPTSGGVTGDNYWVDVVFAK